MIIIDFKQFETYPVTYNECMDNAVTNLIVFYTNVIKRIKLGLIVNTNNLSEYKNFKFANCIHSCPLCNACNDQCELCIYAVIRRGCIDKAINYYMHIYNSDDSNNSSIADRTTDEWIEAITNRIDMLTYLQTIYKTYKHE